MAIPLLAVTELGAGPGQAGALGALSTAAFLLIGLPAGAWVDRLPTRRVLVVADVARAALFASVPVAWWAGTLSLLHLYVVVLLSGCATVFFDVGSQSILPDLVGRDRLVTANAAIVGLTAGANVAGRGAGGLLVQTIAGPLAAGAAALSYAASAVGLARVTGPGLAPTPRAERRRLPAEVREGLRHVIDDRRLRALALTASLTNLGAQTVNVVLPVMVVGELGLPEAALGAYWAAGGVGILLGAACARRLAARFGPGRTLALAGLWFAPAACAVPFVDAGWWLALAAVGWLASTTRMGIDNVLGVTLRQRLTPDALLGRMNATFRFLLTGALAIGSAVGGLIGETLGTQVAVWVGAACLAGAFLPVVFSPVRDLRELPAPAVGDVAVGPPVTTGSVSSSPGERDRSAAR